MSASYLSAVFSEPLFRAVAVIAAVVALQELETRTTCAQLCVQLNGTNYTQNFNTLPNSGSSNTASSLPVGFAYSESGANGNLTYAAGDGSSSAGNTYSFGATSSADRALGELTTSGVQSTLGACFVNNTDHAMTSVVVGYTGELWRLGIVDLTDDKLNFQFSTDATSLSDGTWTDVNSLDLNTPPNASVAGALDGNSAVNRTVIPPFAITPAAAIQPERTFFIRWVPVNIAGENDGLAIDDFALGTTLAAGLAGDYNSNGHVDGGDYVVFRNLLNQAAAMANDITPGTVVQQDFNEWRQRFGSVNLPGAGSGTAAAATIPEPSLVSLVLLPAAGCFTRRHSSSRGLLFDRA